MTATADLRAEHVGVGRMLGILDSMSARARGGDRLDADDLSQTLDFLRVFVDKCHHGKEEDLLFPAMRAAGLVSAEPTIVVLLDDHVRGRETVRRIDAATRALAADEPSALDELADAMTDYTALLHAHIRREEGDCFSVADRELPATVQDEVVEGYERIERDVIGGGVHEAFHELLGRLEREYRG